MQNFSHFQIEGPMEGCRKFNGKTGHMLETVRNAAKFTIDH